jgi:hypothetical protein
MNLIGLSVAVLTGTWYLKQIYAHAYLPLLLMIIGCGGLGFLPRAGRSTRNEGLERRSFYGAVWAISLAQVLLLLLWKALPRTHTADVVKLVTFLAVVLALGGAAILGVLPRTRPILPGQLMAAD